jgi:GntR family transcriptional regulator
MHRPKSAVARGNRAGITRYLQLYHHLASELVDGRFRPDEPLPSEPELVRLHLVSRTTVRRALDRLEREGRIERRRGSGTYARALQAESRLEIALAEFCDLHSKGTGRTLSTGLEAVPRSFQTRHAALGQKTRTLRRLRSRHGEPFQLDSIYLCKANGEAVKILSVTHEMSAITANASAARYLGVVVGTPLLRLQSQFLGKGNRLLAVSDSVIRSDRASVRTDLQREGQNARWTLKRS